MKRTRAVDLDGVLAGIAEGARAEGERGPFPPGDLVLYGAGRLGRKALAGLRRLGRPPLAFADASEALQGKPADGLSVFSPDEALRRFPGARVVLAIWSPGRDRAHAVLRERLRQIGAQQVSSFVELFRAHPVEFLPHYRVDTLARLHAAAPRIRKAFALLSDDVSRREFAAQLDFVASPDAGDEGMPPSAPAPTYLPADLFALAGGDVMVDAGAYDGDTIRSVFAARPGGIAQIRAFEPDPGNYERLLAFRARLPEPRRSHVVPRQAALGEARGRVRFEAQGTVGSAVSATGEIEVESVSLDEEVGDAPVTFVKMDIEGAEISALSGAERVIRRDAPILAICVYHFQEHLWEIPLRLASLSDRYRLFLRRYGDSWGDVVCYAVPDSRLLPGAAG